MPQLRGFLQRFRKGQPLWSFCDSVHHNRVAEVLENILGVGCRIDKPIDGSPWKIIVDGSSDVFIPETDIGSIGSDGATFYATRSGSSVTVTAGTIRLHSIGNYPVAQTTVILSGTPCWVFVWHQRDHSASGIDQQATEPTSDTNIIRVPLAKYILTGDTYSMAERCHKYDINIDAPMR